MMSFKFAPGTVAAGAAAGAPGRPLSFQVSYITRDNAAARHESSCRLSIQRFRLQVVFQQSQFFYFNTENYYLIFDLDVCDLRALQILQVVTCDSARTTEIAYKASSGLWLCMTRT